MLAHARKRETERPSNRAESDVSAPVVLSLLEPSRTSRLSVIATPRRFAEPKVCLPDRLDSPPAVVLAYSARRFGLGSKGSISLHCSSVNSICHFFMAEAQQLNHLKRASRLPRV
jgi:hypothetical protein